MNEILVEVKLIYYPLITLLLVTLHHFIVIVQAYQMQQINVNLYEVIYVYVYKIQSSYMCVDDFES